VDWLSIKGFAQCLIIPDDHTVSKADPSTLESGQNSEFEQWLLYVFHILPRHVSSADESGPMEQHCNGLPEDVIIGLWLCS